MKTFQQFIKEAYSPEGEHGLSRDEAMGRKPKKIKYFLKMFPKEPEGFLNHPMLIPPQRPPDPYKTIKV